MLNPTTQEIALAIEGVMPKVSVNTVTWILRAISRPGNGKLRFACNATVEWVRLNGELAVYVH